MVPAGTAKFKFWPSLRWERAMAITWPLRFRTGLPLEPEEIGAHLQQGHAAGYLVGQQRDVVPPILGQDACGPGLAIPSGDQQPRRPMHHVADGDHLAVAARQQTAALHQVAAAHRPSNKATGYKRKAR